VLSELARTLGEPADILRREVKEPPEPLEPDTKELLDIFTDAGR
jgi:hypothetical protein